MDEPGPLSAQGGQTFALDPRAVLVLGLHPEGGVRLTVATRAVDYAALHPVSTAIGATAAVNASTCQSRNSVRWVE